MNSKAPLRSKCTTAEAPFTTSSLQLQHIGCHHVGCEAYLTSFPSHPSEQNVNAAVSSGSSDRSLSREGKQHATVRPSCGMLRQEQLVACEHLQQFPIPIVCGSLSPNDLDLRNVWPPGLSVLGLLHVKQYIAKDEIPCQSRM